MNEATYQGHAGEGGLQNHSIGGCYPFTVFGKGAPTMYGVLNCATGEESAVVFTCAGAWELASAAKAGHLNITYFGDCLRHLAQLTFDTGADQ